MGICSSNNNNNNKKQTDNLLNPQNKQIENKIFSISNSQKIIPNQDLKENLKFQITINNFRLRNVKENFRYFITLDFPFNTKGLYVFKLSTGPLAKFSFNENFTILVPFSKLQSSYLKIVSSKLKLTILLKIENFRN